MKRLFILSILFSLAGLSAWGVETTEPILHNIIKNRKGQHKLKDDTLSTYLQNYMEIRVDPVSMKRDTVSFLYYRYFADLDSVNDVAFANRYIPDYPQYWQMFTRHLTYFYSPIGRYSRMLWSLPEDAFPNIYKEQAQKWLPYDTLAFSSESEKKIVDDALLAVYINRPRLVGLTEAQLQAISAFREDITPRMASNKNVLRLFEPEPVNTVQQRELKFHKPNWWQFGGNLSLQFSQNYVSDNWYKGGESSNSLVYSFKLFANYNDREKLQFENSLETKLSIYSSPSDQFHKYLINADQFRLYSKLGIQASHKWYYTVSAEIKTQLLNNYKANTESRTSSFLAPGDLTLSLGMDYKNKKKKYNFSLFLAPITYNLRYVGDSRVNAVNYGLSEGHHFQHNIGSQIQPTLEWTIIPAIKLESRLNYLTSYKWTRVEWENTANFILNRYLSTKIYVHARYDDSATPTSGNSYYQLNELLSFGINYQW